MKNNNLNYEGIEAIPEIPTFYTKEDTYVTASPEAPVDKETTSLILKFGQIPLIGAAGVTAWLAWGHMTAQWAIVISILIYSILSFVLWRFTLLVATGKFLKLREMRNKNKQEIKRQQSVDLMYEQRMALARQIVKAAAKHEKRRLKHEAEMQQIRFELAQLRSHKTIAMRDEDGEFNTIRGRITAKVSPERTQLLQWIFGDEEMDGLYGWDGQPNPEKVDPQTGKILSTTRMPWSQGICSKNSETWREISRPIQWPVVFRFEKDMGNAWLLNIEDYGTAESLERAIGTY